MLPELSKEVKCYLHSKNRITENTSKDYLEQMIYKVQNQNLMGIMFHKILMPELQVE